MNDQTSQKDELSATESRVGRLLALLDGLQYEGHKATGSSFKDASLIGDRILTMIYGSNAEGALRLLRSSVEAYGKIFRAAKDRAKRDETDVPVRFRRGIILLAEADRLVGLVEDLRNVNPTLVQIEYVQNWALKQGKDDK